MLLYSFFVNLEIGLFCFWKAYLEYKFILFLSYYLLFDFKNIIPTYWNRFTFCEFILKNIANIKFLILVLV